MIVEKYGIQLKKITIDDIELIRTKRNADYISSKMIFRDYISPKQQLKWFESINNFNNFYYLICVDGQPIGLISDKNSDWNQLISEAGLFIWEEKYLKTLIPSYATLCLLELGYEVLSWNKTVIKVLASNKEALTYNKQIGFKITEQNKDVVDMVLDRKSYFEKARKMIVSLTKSQEEKILKVSVKNTDTFFIDKVTGIISKFNIPATINVGIEDTVFKYQIIA